ncbi:response regulator transcription factor [Lipingzhangella sp. LS1_29]|uniref:Response regulator transcription factor n=1 Tax=Lipingzhangella rawalii TaxID=2055835 RepID=A0ABU2H725_9ACTN|nr:response regulator transcription factor [Lipingzhangella rawalii]MDS1271105.1 response regulator transcription factor [Lipingzhangella rawalii]
MAVTADLVDAPTARGDVHSEVTVPPPRQRREPRLLCLESSPEQGRRLAGALSVRGVSVRLCTEPLEGLLRAGLWRPDLAVVSADLAAVPGVRLVQLLHTTLGIPVVVGVSDPSDSRGVNALAAGAVACLPRPYDLGVVLRLAGVRGGADGRWEPAPEPLRCGHLVVDEDLHQVRTDGRSLVLPTREFRLLSHLVRHAPRAVTRSELRREIWSDNRTVDTNTITVHVRRLRRRLRELGEGATGCALVTVRGVGYRMEVVSRWG